MKIENNNCHFTFSALPSSVKNYNFFIVASMEKCVPSILVIMVQSNTVEVSFFYYRDGSVEGRTPMRVILGHKSSYPASCIPIIVNITCIMIFIVFV